jgi:transposase-like protein
MPSSYPAEVRRQVVALARSGTRVVQLAETFGMTQATIYNWLKQERIDRGEAPGLSTEGQMDGFNAAREGPPRLVRGRIEPSKSRYGRRDVPLDHELVLALRELRTDSEWPGDDDLVFTAGNGSPLMPTPSPVIASG